METLSALLLALVFPLFLFSLLNAITVRTVKPGRIEDVSELVSVLAPLRNESQNVSALMSSLLGQDLLRNHEVIVLDDNSEDDTSELLAKYSEPQLSVIFGQSLPESWLGKNFACHQLAERSQGDFLVFVDADVRLDPKAIAASINLMKSLNWDFISPYPRQIAVSFLERLTQPLLQWSWFATLPLRFAQRFMRPSTVVANGQFLIIKRQAYFNSGGHQAVRSEVLDDLELARNLIRSGFKGGVVDGSKIAVCRMYSNAKELVEGYTKSQWRAFVNPYGAAFAVLLLFATSIAPLLLGVLGEIYGWYAYFIMVASRLLVGFKTGSVLSSASLHPLSAGVWIFLIINSWIQKYRGALTWRGRSL